jgi:hypothetical protein
MNRQYLKLSNHLAVSITGVFFIATAGYLWFNQAGDSSGTFVIIPTFLLGTGFGLLFWGIWQTIQEKRGLNKPGNIDARQASSPGSIRYLLVIILPVLVTAGIYLLFQSGKSYYDLWRLKTWSTTQGAIANTRIMEQINLLPNGEKEIHYILVVLYTYAVDGQPYVGDHIRLGEVERFNTRAQAENARRLYPPFSATTVYYNPQDPQDALMEICIRCSSPLQGLAVLSCAGILGFILRQLTISNKVYT